MSNSLMSTMLKTGFLCKDSDVLNDSKYFNNQDMIPTDIYILNVVLSGSIRGGLTPGIHTFAGPSKHFKTMYGLIMCRAYMNKYPEAIVIFYDNEFGAGKKYFEAVGIDTKRVLHIPFTNIENLRNDIVQKLEAIKRGDKVIILIDSIGNAASKKEVDDAMNDKGTEDMTRAKKLKSLFRIITPHTTLKDICIIPIAHTYDTQEMYSKKVVSGGQGIMLSSQNVYVLGRQQEKDGKEVVGYNFVVNIEKSRYVREKQKFNITVTHTNGLNRYTGLMDIALLSGHVVKPKNGWYTRVINGEQEERNWRIKDTSNKGFWQEIIDDPTFDEWIMQNFQVSGGNLIHEEEEVDDTDDEDDTLPLGINSADDEDLDDDDFADIE